MMYGIKKHRKGDKYENDCFVLDKDYRIAAMSKEGAEVMLRIFKRQYGNDYSFQIVRLD